MLAAWLAFAVHSGPAQAVEFSDTTAAAGRVGEAAFDLIVLRPLSACALVMGTVFFAASVPLVAPDGWYRTGSPIEAVRPAWSNFVYAPYEYTALRPLGDF